MPELPEVETTVRGLRKKVLQRTFFGLWADTEKIIKKPGYKEFKKEIKGKKILNIYRRAKNIIFELSRGYSLLIHQKMTGHLLFNRWPKEEGRYIRLMFFLDNGQTLALSDLRKFAKVELWETGSLKKELKIFGPEPLEKGFTFKKFRPRIKKGKIKQVLMDQKVIAGIGNIYSDEILWEARVNPFRLSQSLSLKELKDIYLAIKNVLKKAIKLKGTSISDYRDINGQKGFFQKERKVYQREGENCSRCGAKIKRAKMGGRSAHFCPFCQK